MVSLSLFSEIRMVSNHLSVYLLIVDRKWIVGELYSSGIPYSWVYEHFCNFIFSQSRPQKLVLEDVTNIG